MSTRSRSRRLASITLSWKVILGTLLPRPTCSLLIIGGDTGIQSCPEHFLTGSVPGQKRGLIRLSKKPALWAFWYVTPPWPQSILSGQAGLSGIESRLTSLENTLTARFTRSWDDSWISVRP